MTSKLLLSRLRLNPSSWTPAFRSSPCYHSSSSLSALQSISADASSPSASYACFSSASESDRLEKQQEEPVISPAAVGLGDAVGDAGEGDAAKKKDSGMWRAFKMMLGGSIIAGLTGSAYATYAYTAEEVDAKISSLRLSAESKVPKNEGLLEKVEILLYSTTLKAASKVAEIYLEIRKSIEDQIQGFAAPPPDKLLPDLAPQEQHVFTLVLDLNETLVYTDWKRDRGWRTFKRPGIDAFLEHLAQYYELVIYSDQVAFQVDPILERLDQKGCIRYRLSRESTQYIHGKHFRDLSKLNRDPSRVIYLSAHALDTTLQPENALPIEPWKLETDDTALLDYLPFLEYIARCRPSDIRPVLASYRGHDIPTEFRERTKEYQRKMQELKQQNRFWKGSAVSRSS